MVSTWLLAIAPLVAVADAAVPVFSEADEVFLHSQAHRIADSARLERDHATGKWKNSTGVAIHVPGGNMGYPAFWVRDAAMMLGSDFISTEEVAGWIRLICATIRSTRWNVRPGVVVPAYAVPDHINLDGNPTFYPGNYETGDKQGGGNWGKYPPLDDQFYFVEMVYRHWKMAGSARLLSSQMRMADGQARLVDLCERAYDAARADSRTGLCEAGDIGTENAKDFGFCDGVFKSGKLLFPSVLKLIAARELEQMVTAAGEPARAVRFRNDTARMTNAIPAIFFHSGTTPDEGWLYSATETGSQPDVWGSAFAVYSQSVDGETARRVSRALVRGYRDRTAVREGCVRHLLSNDRTGEGGWQKTIVPLGEYQNGGYWGTPAGWYIAAMTFTNPAAAAQMGRDYVHFLRSALGPDGMSAAWEWFNPDTGKHANPLYVATVALPYASLQNARMLRKRVRSSGSGR